MFPVEPDSKYPRPCGLHSHCPVFNSAPGEWAWPTRLLTRMGWCQQSVTPDTHLQETHPPPQWQYGMQTKVVTQVWLPQDRWASQGSLPCRSKSCHHLHRDPRGTATWYVFKWTCQPWTPSFCLCTTSRGCGIALSQILFQQGLQFWKYTLSRASLFTGSIYTRYYAVTLTLF